MTLSLEASKQVKAMGMQQGKSHHWTANRKAVEA